MGNTATLQSATPNRLTYLLVGDGTVVGPTIASATLIADAVAGPLDDLLSAVYANQAAMRAVFGGGNVLMLINMRVTVNDVTGQENQVSADVDVDAVTATRPEVNIEMSDTTGQEAYLTLLNLHSLVQ